jgi:uncharacterized repeat protein (TIGR01451 family)
MFHWDRQLARDGAAAVTNVNVSGASEVHATGAAGPPGPITLRKRTLAYGGFMPARRETVLSRGVRLMKHLIYRFILACATGLAMLCAAVPVSHAATPTITVLHGFLGPDGYAPFAPLVQASDGNFYGTTYHGGDDGQGCAGGCDGTIFKITPQGQFTLLHTFVGGGTTPAWQNGRNPSGGLVEGPDGYLYGTTLLGGVAIRLSDGVSIAADGTAYRISKTGQFQKIHDFNSQTQPEGGEPQGSLFFHSDGYLYGTTTSPPAFPQLFRMSSSGIYTTIASLYNTGLGTPRNGLVQASDGSLYGVANGGIYRVTPPSVFAPVYFFNTPSDGTGNSELIQASDGTLYGATTAGPGNSGFVFRSSLGGNHQNVLGLSASTTGTVPNALLQATDGNLWGTTQLGNQGGFVYATTTNGVLLQSLPLTPSGTGVSPVAPLIQGLDGKLYGTASGYGPNNASGTIFVVDAGLPPPRAMADLALSKVGSPNPVAKAGMLTYTMVVTNDGPSAATEVTLADPLASARTYVSASSTQGSCAVSRARGAAALNCAVGTLGKGASATITLVVKAPRRAGVISNTATVGAAEADPNPANNSATAAVTVH